MVWVSGLWLTAVPRGWIWIFRIFSHFLTGGGREHLPSHHHARRRTKLRYCPAFLKERPLVHQSRCWSETWTSSQKIMRNYGKNSGQAMQISPGRKNTGYGIIAGEG